VRSSIYMKFLLIIPRTLALAKSLHIESKEIKLTKFVSSDKIPLFHRTMPSVHITQFHAVFCNIKADYAIHVFLFYFPTTYRKLQKSIIQSCLTWSFISHSFKCSNVCKHVTLPRPLWPRPHRKKPKRDLCLVPNATSIYNRRFRIRPLWRV